MTPRRASTLQAYCRFLVRWHRGVIVALFSLAWAATAILIINGRFKFQNYAVLELLVEDDIFVDQMDMANAAMASSDTSIFPEILQRPRARMVSPNLVSFQLVFNSTASLYTGKNLRRICEIENVLRRMPDFDEYCYDGDPHLPFFASYSNHTRRWCSAQFTSPTPYFYIDWRIALPFAQQKILSKFTPLALVLEPPQGVARSDLLKMGPVFEQGLHTRR